MWVRTALCPRPSLEKRSKKCFCLSETVCAQKQSGHQVFIISLFQQFPTTYGAAIKILARNVSHWKEMPFNASLDAWKQELRSQKKTGRFFFPVGSFLKRSGAFSGDDSLPFSKDSLSVGPFERNCQLLALSVLKNYSNPRHDVMRRKRKCPF